MTWTFPPHTRSLITQPTRVPCADGQACGATRATTLFQFVTALAPEQDVLLRSIGILPCGDAWPEPYTYAAEGDLWYSDGFEPVLSAQSVVPIPRCYTVVVNDPDTTVPVDITIYKDPQSGALFGIDASAIEQQIVKTMASPFNLGTVFVLMD